MEEHGEAGGVGTRRQARPRRDGRNQTEHRSQVGRSIERMTLFAEFMSLQVEIPTEDDRSGAEGGNAGRR